MCLFFNVDVRVGKTSLMNQYPCDEILIFDYYYCWIRSKILDFLTLGYGILFSIGDLSGFLTGVV